MTDKPDPTKDAGRTDAAGSKRPHATLDLKATEVKPAESTPASLTGPATSASASSTAGASSAVRTEGKNPEPKTAPQATPAQASAKATSSDTAPKTAAKEPPGAKPGAAANVSRGGGMFSHLAAGIVGGGLVYGASALLGPAGLPVLGPDTRELDARLAKLEQRPADTGGLDAVSAKVGAAEERLAKLEQIDQSLRETQDKIAAETNALTEAAQKGASPERLSKLEEQLSLIAQSAPASDGRVPQLAALTGKISDLEAALNTQITQLRNSLPREVEERLAAAAEASEAAKSGTQRLDRELSALRTDQARAAQRVDNTKADTDRIGALVEAVREQSGKLSSTVGELRSSIDAQAKTFAKLEDIKAAIEPVAGKVAALEESVAGVVKSEQDRKENAERIVLSLELSNLKRALDRGAGYAAELAEVRKAAGGRIDLQPLERYKETGVATLAELEAEFRPVMNAVIDADTDPVDGSVIDRLWAGAKTVVRVRKINADPADKSAEAVIARMETALREGHIGEAIAYAQELPQRASGPIQDWLTKAGARHSVDVAIAGIEDQLKASLAGTPDAEQPAPAKPSN
jgi:hypothetical protein